MAIAALVLHCAGGLPELAIALEALPGVVDKRQVPPDKIALTLEAPSQDLTGRLKSLKNLPNIWDLELVYVNYEDDLDAHGHIACPAISEIRDKLSE